ncbi:DUF3822 family protein [Flavobacteriaceae bacterium]|nr:DUF3822 family protein [Flavobacteriaceae bacterium]
MTQQNNNTYSNKQNKLSILINRYGLSHLISDADNKNIVDLSSHNFVDHPPEEELHHFVDKYLNEKKIGEQSYSDIRVCFVNNLSSFIPLPLFDKNKKATYLENHADIRKQDYVSFDDISSIQIANVYIPYVNVNNMLLESFGKFSYVHCSSLLLEILSKENTKNTQPLWFVHIQYNLAYYFLLVKGKLQFYNAFNWTDEKDVLYYAMAVAKNNSLALHETTLLMSGQIKGGDKIHQLLSKYIIKTSFFTPSNKSNKLSSTLLHPHTHTLLTELPTCEL